MGDFWKPTAEMFADLIEKPKMTEKLLSKPPFKYIFDIIIETSKKTNYGKGKALLIHRSLYGSVDKRRLL
jgi:TRAF3-interacting protein 1